MLEMLPTARAALAKSHLMAAMAHQAPSVVTPTHADNRLLICITGTPYGILAVIDDDAIAMSIKAPGHPPRLAKVARNDADAIDDAVTTLFNDIASGRIFG